METYNEFVKNQLTQLGIDEVGFARVAGELPYAVSIVVPLSRYVVEQITDRPTHTYFHHYRTVNAFIDQTLLRCGLEIGKLGFRYLCVPASQSIDGTYGLFQHKTAARLAGLGRIGKSTLFLSNRYGPAVRLGTILTDMPVAPGTPCTDDCGDCNLCVQKCPAMAIRGVNYRDGLKREEMFDAHACSQHMKQAFQRIGRGAVCGICMRYCKEFQRKG